MVTAIHLRVAARYEQAVSKTADQPAGQRKHDKDMIKPINPPKGISRPVIKDTVVTEDDANEDQIKPNRRDIRPEDVFVTRPKNVSVRNLVETGKDMDKAIRNQIPKDKGYDTVKNLSQYLVETGGGGGTKPVG